jgi:hypothetical protein
MGARDNAKPTELIESIGTRLETEVRSIPGYSFPAHLTALLEADLLRIGAECGLSDLRIEYSLSSRIVLKSHHCFQILLGTLPTSPVRQSFDDWEKRRRIGANSPNWRILVCSFEFVPCAPAFAAGVQVRPADRRQCSRSVSVWCVS